MRQTTFLFISAGIFIISGYSMSTNDLGRLNAHGELLSALAPELVDEKLRFVQFRERQERDGLTPPLNAKKEISMDLPSPYLRLPSYFEIPPYLESPLQVPSARERAI